MMGYLRVSDNGHYFTRDGQPFFWLGDTIWPACNVYSDAEIADYLTIRQQQGFTVIHLMLPWNGGFEVVHPETNYDGEPLWLDGNPATPNERFFAKLDRFIRLAADRGMLTCILPCGGSYGSYVHKNKVITADNARAYGKWLGRRYAAEPNILWSNGFDLPPWSYEDVANAFAAGITEGDAGKHLLFYHPSGFTSSNHFHQEDWLSANFIQTWSDYSSVYGMVLADRFRKPHKPVVHVEGAYEAGEEYPTGPITAQTVRFQAYSAYFAGGFHSYGHNDLWRKTDDWRDALYAPGASQMNVLREIFTSLHWWTLRPCVPDSPFGVKPPARSMAAATADGRCFAAYISCRATVTLQSGALDPACVYETVIIDAQTGERTDTGTLSGAEGGRLTIPPRFEDAVIVIKPICGNESTRRRFIKTETECLVGGGCH